MKKEINDSEVNTIDKILQLPLLEVIENSHAALFFTDDCDIIRWRNKVNFPHPIPGADINLVLNKSIHQGIAFFKSFLKYPEYYKQKVLTLIKERQPYYCLSLEIIDGSIFQLNYIPISFEIKFLGALCQFT